MQRGHAPLENAERELQRLRVDGLPVGGFDHFEVPRAEIAPDEVVEIHQRIAQAVVAEVLLVLGQHLRQFLVDPAHGKLVGNASVGIRLHFPTLDQPQRIPHFIAEITPLLA